MCEPPLLRSSLAKRPLASRTPQTISPLQGWIILKAQIPRLISLGCHISPLSGQGYGSVKSRNNCIGEIDRRNVQSPAPGLPAWAWSLDLWDPRFWPSLSLSRRGLGAPKPRVARSATLGSAPRFSGFNPEWVASRSIRQPRKPRSPTGQARGCNPCQGC